MDYLLFTVKTEEEILRNDDWAKTNRNITDANMKMKVEEKGKGERREREGAGRGAGDEQSWGVSSTLTHGLLCDVLSHLFFLWSCLSAVSEGTASSSPGDQVLGAGLEMGQSHFSVLGIWNRHQ